MTDNCDVCDKPVNETNTEPYMSTNDYGYKERVGTCNCDACPECGYIHQNWCEQVKVKDLRDQKCSSCGTSSENEYCKYCEKREYGTPEDEYETCTACGYKHMGDCKVDLKEYKKDDVKEYTTTKTPKKVIKPTEFYKDVKPDKNVLAYTYYPTSNLPKAFKQFEDIEQHNGVVALIMSLVARGIPKEGWAVSGDDIMYINYLLGNLRK